MHTRIRAHTHSPRVALTASVLGRPPLLRAVTRVTRVTRPPAFVTRSNTRNTRNVQHGRPPLLRATAGIHPAAGALFAGYWAL
jgi:hypothetical protein